MPTNTEISNPDWETLAKRLLVAGHLGIRIEQESGHRWIYLDAEADHFPPALAQSGSEYLKEYGSFVSALDRIEKMLVSAGQPTLLEQFANLNYYDDLGVIFGEGTQ